MLVRCRDMLSNVTLDSRKTLMGLGGVSHIENTTSHIVRRTVRRPGRIQTMLLLCDADNGIFGGAFCCQIIGLFACQSREIISAFWQILSSLVRKPGFSDLSWYCYCGMGIAGLTKSTSVNAIMLLATLCLECNNNICNHILCSSA